MSQIADLRLIETGDGGDLVLVGNDVQLIGGLQNMPYIGLFGGNPGFSTTGAKDTNQAFDWFGNFVLSPGEPLSWFNSTVEFLIENSAITSSGRAILEQAVLTDLQFMRAFSEVTASVSVIGIDRIKIDITILEPGQLTANEFQYIWDATEQELNTGQPTGNPGNGIGLGNMLGFEL